MQERDTWTTLFFSGRRPDILTTNEIDSKNFRAFCAEDDNWNLGRRLDDERVSDPNTVQVFWFRVKGRRKYIAKVDAKIQLSRVGIFPTPERVDDAVYEFDRFYREARAYSQIDLFCSPRERIYFPQFYGVLTDIPRSRFSSGYCHERAVVLDAVRPELGSRRILSEDVNHLPRSFSITLQTLSETLCTTPEMASISPFEQKWYHSLLKDRLRRLDALHRIGITHGDIHDFHFRLPNDIYDTVLYDFSESYTFSEKQPFRVNSGKPRPLGRISAGERERVLLHIHNRATSRDLRSYFIGSIPEASVDNALWQSLDDEEELLELIMLKTSWRPDGQSLLILFPYSDY
ncbi:uncharacterized protein N7459_002671 [Penicillium hispanicum]|uniref:uncharacterized protein n=1 Tax=Penicillium hispanicum TaxID=1080232 RepID=UPI0025416469|nr:uncharacterized protein N7459_002671 [Penicillium hispanicum]KAJ5586906.1 hypothetical protein N7459_002671 [Penicillium hispanicum]